MSFLRPRVQQRRRVDLAAQQNKQQQTNQPSSYSIGQSLKESWKWMLEQHFLDKTTPGQLG